MNKTTSISLLLIGLLLAGGSRAAAQTPDRGKLFINVNGGAQTQSRSVDNSFSLPVYGQTATWTTTATIPSGGFFDLSVGYKVMAEHRHRRRLLDLQRHRRRGWLGVDSEPDLLQPSRSVAIPESPAERKEAKRLRAAVGFVPVTDKVDVAVSIGPSFTRVEQSLITAVSIPAGTQNVNPTIRPNPGPQRASTSASTSATCSSRTSAPAPSCATSAARSISTRPPTSKPVGSRSASAGGSASKVKR